jgi:hypothetical protein
MQDIEYFIKNLKLVIPLATHHLMSKIINNYNIE